LYSAPYITAASVRTVLREAARLNERAIASKYYFNPSRPACSPRRNEIGALSADHRERLSGVITLIMIRAIIPWGICGAPSACQTDTSVANAPRCNHGSDNCGGSQCNSAIMSVRLSQTV
jgi:hypothetical protein